jgi:hypothetical protein
MLAGLEGFARGLQVGLGDSRAVPTQALAILLLAKFNGLLHPSTISRIKLSPPAVASERLSVNAAQSRYMFFVSAAAE